MRRRRGASAIETALLMPVVVVGMIGFIEYSWFFFMEMNVAAGARNSARIAAGVPVDMDPAGEFNTEMAGELRTYNLAGSVESWVSGDAGDRLLNVVVSVPWDGITGIVPVPTTITYDTTVRLEDQEV